MVFLLQATADSCAASRGYPDLAFGLSFKPKLEFVEPSKRYADVIIPLGGHNTVAVDLLLTMLRSVAGR